jgi:SNF2 family DNA or RNA helicase
LAKVKFDFIGLDEALIKDPSTNRTKDLTWLGRRIPHRMLMSGTLVNNSPLDVFAPVRFLEPSLTSWSFTKFKDEYAVQIPVKQGHGKFVVGFRKVPEIKSILESVSIVMTKDEWLQLPKKYFENNYVQLSDEQRKAYNDLQSNYIVTIGDNTLEIDNPLVALTKLIQISNGFLYLDNNDNLDELDANASKKAKKRKTYFFPSQPKLEALIRILKGDLKNKRCMVWFNMEGEYELISKRFEKEGITYISIKGGEKHTGDKVRTFNSDPRVQVLLCQAKSVNYGITVLGKDYDEADLLQLPLITPEVFTQVFYSINFSLEVYLQQQDRIHRLGQEHECCYIIITANSDAERRVVDAITDKQDIRGQLLEDVISSLGLKR